MKDIMYTVHSDPPTHNFKPPEDDIRCAMEYAKTVHDDVIVRWHVAFDGLYSMHITENMAYEECCKQFKKEN